MPGNRATHQNPITSTRQDGDVTYLAKLISPGVYADRSIELDSVAPNILTATLTIPSASVLTLNSVPLVIIPAFSVAQGIVPLFGLVDFINATVPYATNVVAYIGASGLTSTTYVMEFNIDEGDGERLILYPQASAGLGTAAMALGEALYIKVLGGNPTAGDGTLVVTIYYQII